METKRTKTKAENHYNIAKCFIIIPVIIFLISVFCFFFYISDTFAFIVEELFP